MKNIRLAILKDYSAIHKLSMGLGYNLDSPEVTKQRISEVFNTKDNYIWVFEEDTIIKGWIHAFVAHRVASASFVELGGLVVDEKYRRQGIGRRLVEYVIAWAKEHNLKTRVRCNVKRDETHQFYEALGFSNEKSQHVFEKKLLNPHH